MATTSNQLTGMSCFPSSSPSPPRWQVFLSFRGKDTRNNFTAHLYFALTQAGIRTFRDDSELEKGETISTELVKAIHDSKVSIVVLSKNYASSSWCLNELVEILDCKRTKGQVVLPVFYHVDPSDVRHQNGSFAEAFETHHKRVSSSMDMVEKWKAALTVIANLSGYNLKDDSNGHEIDLIQIILNDVVPKVYTKALKVDEHLVGIDSHVQDIYKKLITGSNDVHAIGICGMGGIGKTTIAKAFYNSYMHQFEASCFLDNVSENSKGSRGLLSLVEQLLLELLKIKDFKIFNVERGLAILKDGLSTKKVLVVLDDLEQSSYLKFLARHSNSFCAGSRIIITTRDAHLLRELQVTVYMVKNLGVAESLELFSYHAFRRTNPLEDFRVLSEKIVNYVGGLPLALKVLGSFLIGREVLAWKSTLEKLQKIPNKEIQNILKLSYDALDDDKIKKIFLDIACFYIGMDKDEAVNIFNSCGFFPDIGIDVLVERCLLTIDLRNKFTMHNLIRQMGKEVAHEEGSRLWCQGNECDELKNHKSIFSYGVWLFFSKLSSIVNFVNASPKRKTEVEDLHKLELEKMIVSGELGTSKGSNQMVALQRGGTTGWSSHFFSVRSVIAMYSAVCIFLLDLTTSGSTNAIRGGASGEYGHMRSFDFVFLLHLMHKTMGITNVLCKALQEKSQDLVNAMSLVSTTKTLLEKLRAEGWEDFVVDVLSFCTKHGILVPDMSMLYTVGSGRSCSQKDNVTLEHHYHFDVFVKVIEYQVKELKNRFNDETIELLTLTSALDPHNHFKSFDIDKICRLAEVFYPQDFTGSDVDALRSELAHYELDVVGGDQFQMIATISELCHMLVKTRKSKSFVLIDKLIRLILTLLVSTASTERAFFAMKILKTDLRSKMDDAFLGDIMGADKIEGLILDLTKPRRKPFDAKIFKTLPSLRLLQIHGKNLRGSFKSSLKEVRWIRWHYCPWTRLPSSFSPQNLVSLDMQFSKFSTLWNGAMPLPSLKTLNASHSRCLTTTPDFRGVENLERLLLSSCPRLLKVHPSIGRLANLVDLRLKRCQNLRRLPEELGKIEALKTLDASESAIEQLPDSITCLSNLVELRLRSCKNLSKLPEQSGNMKALKILDASETAIEQLPDSITCLSNLVKLRLRCCKNLSKLPEQSGNMKALKTLDASETAIEQLPDSITCLSNLVKLRLRCCKNLSKLPEQSGNMKALKTLDASDTAIEQLPDSICNLSLLEELRIEFCLKLDRLPEQLGNMQSLKFIIANRTSIKELPDSIGQLSRLGILELESDKKLRNMPNTVYNLTSIVRLHIHGNLLDSVKSLTNLKDLRLHSCDIRSCLPIILCLSSLNWLTLTEEGGPNDSGSLSSTKSLNSGANRCCSPPVSLRKLFNLRTLELLRCASLGSFPELPLKLESLRVYDYMSMEHLDLSSLKQLVHLSLMRCISLRSLHVLPPHLISIRLSGCMNLQNLPDLSVLKALRHLDLRNCSNLQYDLKRILLQALAYSDDIQVFLSNGEIPDWFTYKSTGSTVSFRVPPTLENDILGIGFWVVPPIGYQPFDILTIITNETDGTEIEFGTWFGIVNGRSPIDVVSFVKYGGRNLISMKSGDRIKVSTKTRHDYKDVGLKSGVHLVYKPATGDKHR